MARILGASRAAPPAAFGGRGVPSRLAGGASYRDSRAARIGRIASGGFGGRYHWRASPQAGRPQAGAADGAGAAAGGPGGAADLPDSPEPLYPVSPTDGALAAFDTEAMLRSVEGREDLSDCDVGKHPELMPLRDAVRNAASRLEAAARTREVRESAAQAAGETALEAEARAREARERAVELRGSADLAKAVERAAWREVERAEEAVALVQRVVEGASVDLGSDASADEEAGGGTRSEIAPSAAGESGSPGAPREAASDGAAAGAAAAKVMMTEGAPGVAMAEAPAAAPDSHAPRAVESGPPASPLQPAPAAPLERSPDTSAPPALPLAELRTLASDAEAAAAAAERKAVEAEAVAEEAGAAAAVADAAAAAAMGAAETAVREEMECVAVRAEAQRALGKAIEDLRYLELDAGRRGEEWGRKTGTGGDAAGTEARAGDEGGADAGTGAAGDATGEGSADGASASPERGEAVVEARGAVATAAAPVAAPSVAAASPVPAALTTPGTMRALVAAAAAAALVAAALALNPSLRAGATSLAASARAALGRLPLPHVHDSEKTLLETIWLLLASVLAVPAVCKLPGGSPVLGFLASGALVGPYALGIIQDVESMRHVAELGVVFLLFNIGLELSFDRLRAMGKMVFGLGALQVGVTLAAGALASLALIGPEALSPAGAIVLGGGLALSTTAVAMQVLADRGETGSTHGRAAFSVLLFQDLAVVVLLMLVPLLAPSSDGSAPATGLAAAAKLAAALGTAGVKAVFCMGGIVVLGRRLLQPLYRRVSEAKNAEILAALTLLVVLGTSLITQLAGLSLALGAFLAGLLLAETPFHLQIEADIAPYKGLLMGLFFMTVGMEVSMGLLFARLRTVLASIAALVGGKILIMYVLGKAFGLTGVQSLRAGALLAPGGEFAFVLFGEAVSRGLLGAPLVRELYLVVALSMAATPFLAQGAAKLAKALSTSNVKALSPNKSEAEGLRDHVIICGYGRVGQLIAEMLSESLIPFVALDTDAAAVAAGRAQDLPVYFGDAGSPAVLHAVGAERAACAVITLDTPGANFRTVYTLHKHFPNVRTYVRARDVAHGVQLEKAGATAVVPEVLEPALQLAAAVLTALDLGSDDVAETIRGFRKTHLAQLQELASISGASLGYGAEKPKKGGGAKAGTA